MTTPQTSAIDRLVDDLSAALPHTLIALDFDGTLALIVDDPSAAQLVAGAKRAIEALTEIGARVAIVTARDASDVLSLSGLSAVPDLVVAGLYGAQLWEAGTLTAAEPVPELVEMRIRLAEIVDRGSGSGLRIEDKGLSLVVHGRGAAPDALRDIEPRLVDAARDLGLELHPGREVLEVRMPGFDKGSAVAGVLASTGRRALLYCGDDVGDIPAFDFVARLRQQGAPAWSVAIESVEVPELAADADVAVDGPQAVVTLLERLVAAASGL